MLVPRSALPVLPILAAQSDATRLLADEQTFRTMVTIGLTSGALQLPPVLEFKLFQRLEPVVKDSGVFMDAAIEYVEYARDANDLLRLAQLSRTNGGGPQATSDYLDRCVEATRGAARALDRMVPLLPT